ncbi:MAG: hypothetical protein P8J59_05085 [Phycisphaerales bacterium]|jgi:hypothetical protein|nr:hypothetical protein [Phycisphaerales bacterium]
MNNDRVIQGALLLALSGATAVWFGIAPLHARAAAQQAETSALRARVAESPVPSERLTPFRSELDRRSRMLRDECPDPLIATKPDLAGVIRRLSLPIDGQRVVDQTFTAERSGPVDLDSDVQWSATPIRIELVAAWSAIAEVLNLIETMEIPSRVTEFRLERDSDPAIEMATAFIELDVLHRRIAPEGSE